MAFDSGDPTVLILGAGTLGTSTAYHLSQTYKNASRVTIIDRCPPSELSQVTPSAAIDINRIVRTDYPSLLYCNLAYEALHDWFWKLELQRYFHMVGRLHLNQRGSDLSDRVKKTFHERGSGQAKDISLNQLCSQWKILTGIDLEGFDGAYLNPAAGWCNAAGATASFLDAAVSRGVRKITGEISEILVDTTQNQIRGVRLSDGREFVASKIVVALGAWTSLLLSPVEDLLSLTFEDRIESQIRATGAISAHYRASDSDISAVGESSEHPALPIIVYGEQGELMPPGPGNGLIRILNTQNTFTNTVTTRSGQAVTAPPSNSVDSQRRVPEHLKRETENILTFKIAPKLLKGKKPEYWRICWDALTPTEDFLMCRHPDQRLANLFLATGGSFHAYKFLPIAGKYMVNVLNGESNGEEKDRAWSWKRDVIWESAQASTKKFSPMAPVADLSDITGRAKL